VDRAGGFHDFLRDKRGRYRTFDPPFGHAYLLPPALNNRGQVVGTAFTRAADGQSTDAQGYLLRSGVDGPVTRIDVPGADLTSAFAISDHGTVIGIAGSAPGTADPMPEPLSTEVGTKATT
jgi:hypothetical protein